MLIDTHKKKSVMKRDLINMNGCIVRGEAIKNGTNIVIVFYGKDNIRSI